MTTFKDDVRSTAEANILEESGQTNEKYDENDVDEIDHSAICGKDAVDEYNRDTVADTEQERNLTDTEDSVSPDDSKKFPNSVFETKQSLLCHRTSLESLTEWKWPESRVFIIYTGGTIGMTRNSRGKLVPTPGELEGRLRKYPHMHDEEYCKERFSFISNPPLVLPDCREKRRVVYWVHEYCPLLDSSNMTMDDWIQISTNIKATYEDFDGFVILHGTDTLAYTASALSFMLEHLGKPVVITGSQIPLFETRSDGRDNFIGSVILAGNYNIPEVTVYFNNKLFRGNRTAKVSSGRLNAFDSPNFPPLAVAGITISVDHRNIFRPTTLSKFSVFTHLCRDVGLLRIFPSISTETVRAFLGPIKGAVIQTYGSGNVPSNRKDIIDAFKDASDRGVLIVNITQCMHGGVDAIYETGEALEEAGVIAGFDMTPEAALVKLSYIIAKDVDFETKKKMVQSNLRGEMTPKSKEETEETEDVHVIDDIIASIGGALELASGEDLQHLQEFIIPSLFINAVQNADIPRMDQLSEYVTNINLKDPFGRTCLHLASHEGNLEVVKWLLLKGAIVHVRDSNGHSPLWIAIINDHEKVISLLVQTGAHLTELPTQIGEALVSAASAGNIRRLGSFISAGADINQADSLGRTAMHAACLLGLTSTVRFLLGKGASCLKPDRTNMSPLACAKELNYMAIVRLCKPKSAS